MTRSNKAFLQQLARWRPGLSLVTASKYDEEFVGCLAALLEAARANDEVSAVRLAETVRAWADVLSGQARLEVPLAVGLWDEWTAQLLEVEKHLTVINTAAGQRAFQLLTTLCVVAHAVRMRSQQ